MLQISALIHDTLRPDWLHESCENRNWNIIDYILLSCGHTYVLLALFQECGPMLACRSHCFCIYTLDLCGFIWKLPKPEPDRPWSFCFQNCKQVFIIFSVLISQPLFLHVVPVTKFNLNQMPQLLPNFADHKQKYAITLFLGTGTQR